MPSVKFRASNGKATEQQIKRLEEEWRVTLPEDYRRFLRQTNGGSPDKGCFDCDAGKELWLDDLLPIEGDKPDEGSVSAVTRRCREFVPQDCLVIGFVCRDDLVLLRVRGRRKGQVDLKRMEEADVSRKGPVDPEAAVYPVAKNFAKFVASLSKASDEFEPATFALDKPGVRGEKLDKVLKSLGCKKQRVSGSPSNPTWLWPKYQGRWKDSPAWLEVEKNKTLGYAPKFDERPAGHLMLQISAAAPRRAECLRELAWALGAGAELLSRGG